MATAKPLRSCQNYKQAFWFYRFLSIFYDTANSLVYTEAMREEALKDLDLQENDDLKVVDVGGGTGFTTLGFIPYVKKENITVLDQSPHQLAKAKKKKDLKGVTFVEGNAEDLPFPDNFADRYVSAGSIEYWPDPQRGIAEAFRVVNKGGKACIIGPVYPTFWLSKFFADIWMLFPREENYFEWFEKAGFTDVKLRRIGPSWYRGVRRHGLIIGCAVTGTKPAHGSSTYIPLGNNVEREKEGKSGVISFVVRFIIGYIGGAYFMTIPVYMWLKNKFVPFGKPI